MAHTFLELNQLPFFVAVYHVWRECWVLTACGFLAGLVDSIGGGGGLISVPALLTAGVPTSFILGTNKGMSAIGSGVAAIRYARAGLLPPLAYRSWCVLIVVAVGCGFAGAAFSQSPMVQGNLRVLIPALLILVMIFLAKRWFWDERREFVLSPSAGKPLDTLQTRIAVGIISCYDGVFGPGTGTICLSYLENLGWPTVSANAATKIFNLASNFGALLFFALLSKVLWPVSAAVAAAYMVGNYLGSGLVLRKGQSLVRVTVLLATSLMIVRYFISH